ncbi:hypothetical protein F4823DRAFT_571213 [Ustulina deusta]|nr:hypothetical protein F4823DRAFT_571213 [Ustulina deusta]
MVPGSPLSELPHIGRSPVYFWTMLAFVILSAPTAFVNNYSSLVTLRFLQGFFGSPCLANGGAPLGDLYNDLHVPYAFIAWVSAGHCSAPDACVGSRGNPAFKSQSEIDQQGMPSRDMFVDAPINIKNPAILFVQLYTAAVYVTYYCSFFESFPLVYPAYDRLTAGPDRRRCLRLPRPLLYQPVDLCRRQAPAGDSTLRLFVSAWTARPDTH